MSATWQRSSGDGWEDWMDMRFSRSTELREPFTPGTLTASMRALEPLTGAWSWEGRAKDGSFAVTGRTAFEWLPGGHFLIERGALADVFNAANTASALAPVRM